MLQGERRGRRGRGAAGWNGRPARGLADERVARQRVNTEKNARRYRNPRKGDQDEPLSDVDERALCEHSVHSPTRRRRAPVRVRAPSVQLTNLVRKNLDLVPVVVEEVVGTGALHVRLDQEGALRVVERNV